MRESKLKHSKVDLIAKSVERVDVNFSLFSALIMFNAAVLWEREAHRGKNLIIMKKRRRNFSIINYHAHEFSHVKIPIRVEKCRQLACGTCTRASRLGWTWIWENFFRASSHLTSLIWRKTFLRVIFSMLMAMVWWKKKKKKSECENARREEEGDHITDDDDAMGRPCWVLRLGCERHKIREIVFRRVETHAPCMRW